MPAAPPDIFYYPPPPYPFTKKFNAKFLSYIVDVSSRIYYNNICYKNMVNIHKRGRAIWQEKKLLPKWIF